MYHSLDPVGTRFLDLLQTGGGLDDIHHAMLEEFDVSTARLEADLLKLSQDMLAKGLLERGR
jgi:Coenzyme PQQ synthesis protein D (PqqD)